jgi:exodeoxyribonuclease V
MMEEEHEHTLGPDCDERPVVEADADAADALRLGVDAEEVFRPIVIPQGPCLACHPPPPKRRLEGECPRCHGARYLRRDRLDRDYRLIIADEASMISDDMLEALKAFRLPILAVGDHGQLPPVKGMGSLMRSPDLRLEKIHRQADGNPIIALSARIRATGEIDDSLEDGDAFTVIADRYFDDWIAGRFTAARLALDPRTPEGILGTALVSWTNRTRCNLNERVRSALFGVNGVDEQPPPMKGEAVICLKNEAPIYNGMRGVLLSDAVRGGSDAKGKAPKWKMSVDFVEDGQKAESILASEHQFFAEKTIDYEAAIELGVSMSQLGRLYDFAYALTAHKLQGSQAHEIGLVVEPGIMRMDRDFRTRFLYTSCTRASSKLTVIR